MDMLIYFWITIIGLLFCIAPKKIRIILQTLPYTLQLQWTFANVILRCFIDIVFKKYTVPKKFRQIAKQNPDKIAILFEDQKWTFGEIDTYSNKVAQYFKSIGLKKGDSVAILLDNCPEFVCIVVGLSKLGVISALINTNLKAKETIAHAIKSGKAERIIYGARFQNLIESTKTVMPHLKSYQFNDNIEDTTVPVNAVDFKLELSRASNAPVDKDIDAVTSDDILFFIYTSGTTGLPKATFAKNLKTYVAGIGVQIVLSLTKRDRIYVAVPLYHGLGLMGASQCLLAGCSVVIRKKFSASNFWSDLEKYKCTASLYIGEIVRYVVAAERRSTTKHTYTLKKLIGNGMKSSTWNELKSVLNVEEIYEFYGSTEANFGLCNLVNKIGACGFIPILFDRVNPITIVKCDVNGEPIRNSKGFCQEAEVGEPGLIICQITSVLKFEGYSDAKATSKKILTDVYRKNDRYYNSGDIMSRDEMGFYYFKDRTGDTFRWKGENVSTNEVENVLLAATKRDIAIYGVEIPGNEGKAGMAAVVDKDKTLDLDEFLQQCKSNLPSYSVPIFVRIVDDMPQTGTFKIQKANLAKEGYDINKLKDDIYFLDSRKGSYVKVTSSIYKDIHENKVKV